MRWVNYILQIFCIRVAQCIEKGAIVTGGIKYKVFQWYSIMYWVIPFTGWNDSEYRFLGNQRFFKITKKREVNILF